MVYGRNVYKYLLNYKILPGCVYPPYLVPSFLHNKGVSLILKKMKAKIYKADGTIIDNIVPENGTDFQLGELQKIVGGYIEIVSLLDNEIMVINEEGKLADLPINENATEIYNEVDGFYDYIVGDVLVCDSSMVL